MRRHHRRQLPAQAAERYKVGLAQLRKAALIGGNGHVRIGLGPAMPREVLAAGRHAGGIHAADERPGQLRRTQRVALEGAAAHHGTALVIKVKHRSEAQVQAHCQHFGRHQPATLLGQVFSVVVVGQRAHGGQAHKALAQALHTAALLVHRQNQIGAYGADGCA